MSERTTSPDKAVPYWERWATALDVSGPIGRAFGCSAAVAETALDRYVDLGVLRKRKRNGQWEYAPVPPVPAPGSETIERATTTASATYFDALCRDREVVRALRSMPGVEPGGRTMSNPKPQWDERGVPFCSEDRCPAYDGKRCEITGERPGRICEPAVASLGSSRPGVNDRTARVRVAVAIDEQSRWHATGWIGASDGEAASSARDALDVADTAIHYIVAVVPLPAPTEVCGDVDDDPTRRKHHG